MKQDLHLIVKILTFFEGEHAHGQCSYDTSDLDEESSFKEYSSDQIAYHTELLKDDDWLTGDDAFGYARRMTSQGHKALNLMRDDTLLNRAKAEAIDKGKAWTIELILKLIEKYAKEHVGL